MKQFNETNQILTHLSGLKKNIAYVQILIKKVGSKVEGSAQLIFYLSHQMVLALRSLYHYSEPIKILPAILRIMGSLQ